MKLLLLAALIFSAGITLAYADNETQNNVSPMTQHKEGKLSSGFFRAVNNTDKRVELSVGNFFPTPYTLPPHSAIVISVSTDNQNIQINKIN